MSSMIATQDYVSRQNLLQRMLTASKPANSIASESSSYWLESNTRWIGTPAEVFTAKEVHHLPSGISFVMTKPVNLQRVRISPNNLEPDLTSAVTCMRVVSSITEDPASIVKEIMDNRKIVDRHAIVQRLNDLIEISHDCAPDEDPISIGSLRCFRQFIESSPTIKKPPLTLNSNGYIYASWKNKERFLFSALFLPNMKVEFTLQKPDPEQQDFINQYSGRCSQAELQQFVSSNGLLNKIAAE